MKRQVVSKHDSRSLIEQVEGSAGIRLEVPHSAQVEVVEPEEGVKFSIVDGKYAFVSPSEGTYVPFVGSASAAELFPAARVDVGAVKFILKGADVMRPGIVKYDDWGESGRLVVVRDDAKGRALAVGPALARSADLAALSKGNCIRNLHHAGDRFWNAYRKI